MAEKKKISFNSLKRFPQFLLKNASMNTFLVFTLIIFAFVLGMLTNKVIYLEKAKAVAAAQAPTQQQQQAAVPTPVPVNIETIK